MFCPPSLGEYVNIIHLPSGETAGEVMRFQRPKSSSSRTFVPAAGLATAADCWRVDGAAVGDCAPAAMNGAATKAIAMARRRAGR